MIDESASPAAWSARYERLRANWLCRDEGWGHALFVRQGMAAWMQAWSAAAPPGWNTQHGPVEQVVVPSPAATPSGTVQRELTRAIANLILHRRQEVRA